MSYTPGSWAAIGELRRRHTPATAATFGLPMIIFITSLIALIGGLLSEYGMGIFIFLSLVTICISSAATVYFSWRLANAYAMLLETTQGVSTSDQTSVPM